MIMQDVSAEINNMASEFATHDIGIYSFTHNESKNPLVFGFDRKRRMGMGFGVTRESVADGSWPTEARDRMQVLVRMLENPDLPSEYAVNNWSAGYPEDLESKFIYANEATNG